MRLRWMALAPDVRRASLLIAATALALLAIRFEATPLLRGPAPYPPEWRWGAAAKPWSARALPALACAAGLLALLALSGRAAASRRPAVAVRLLLAGATVLGLGLQLGLRHVDDEGVVAGLVRRTLSGSFTSYHRVAVSPLARDPARYLAHHHELLAGARHRALHAATHPPGPVLLYRGLVELCRRWPRLTDRVDSIVSDSGLETEYLASPPPSPEGIGAALLGPLLIGLLGTLACWPTAALARSLHGDRAAAARAGVLWTLVPAVGLMTPELDQALALPVTASIAALATALRSEEGAGFGWIARALAAGLLAGIAVFFSYGAAVFLLLGALAVLAVAWRGAGRVAPVLGLALAGALAVVALERIAGHRPLASALTAMAIHREQFTTRRSYLAWLVFDPVDLFWFLGPPLALLALVAGARGAWRVASGGATAVNRFQAAVVVGTGALIASGVVRGEAGRILIPIMPLLLVAAVASPERAPDRPGAVAHAGPSVASSLLLGALLVATSLVIRLTWDVP
jgi:hypothetical protein